MRLHHNPVISFADESLCHLVPVSVRLFAMALRLTLIPNTQHCNNKKSDAARSGCAEMRL